MRRSNLTDPKEANKSKFYNQKYAETKGESNVFHRPDLYGHTDAKGVEIFPDCSIASRWSKITQIGRVITSPESAEIWAGRFFFHLVTRGGFSKDMG